MKVYIILRYYSEYPLGGIALRELMFLGGNRSGSLELGVRNVEPRRWSFLTSDLR